MQEPRGNEVALLKRSAFVNRTSETRRLGEAMRRAAAGESSAWLLEGPEGMGKTRLARWAEEHARTEGFEVRWGHGVRDVLVPFQPLELMFRPGTSAGGAGAGTAGPAPPAGPAGRDPALRAPLLLFEETRPRRFWTAVENATGSSSLVVVTRERPAVLRQTRPALERAHAILWMTRLEGADHIAPADLDGLGDRLQDHLRHTKGAAVALEGLEYLVSHGSFLPVLRTLQFLRDVAQESGGQVLLALNPAALEPREVSLVESDAEVDAGGAPTAPAGGREGGTPLPPVDASPTATLLRLLAQVETACERAPQLLVLDDLQWADGPSIRAFQFLVRNTRDRPVVWLACLRSLRPGEEPTAAQIGHVNEVTEHMEREGALQRLGLRPLPIEELQHLVAGATDVPLDLGAGDPEFPRFLEKTGGNPHFALSALRLLWEQGRLRRQGSVAVVQAPPAAAPTVAGAAPAPSELLPAPPSGPGADLALAAPAGPPSAPSSSGPAARDGEHRAGRARAEGAGREDRSTGLPSSLRSAAEERLRLLSEPGRRFLALAAIVGKDFELAPLVEPLGATPEKLAALARELEVSRGLIRPVFGTRDRWSFQDSTAWEVARDLLPPEERRERSRELGSWWAAHRPDDVEGQARLLADSQRAELALPALRKAVESALAQQNPEAVERYLQLIRELSGTDPASLSDRVHETMRAATALRRIGAIPAAVRLLRGLEPVALTDPDRRELDLVLAGVLANNDPGEAWSRLRRLEDQVASLPAGTVDPHFRARMLAVRAALHRYENDFDAGRRAAEEGLQLLPNRRDAELAAALLFESGWCCQELERWAEAKKNFEEALEVSRDGGVPWGVMPALAGLASLNYLLGDLRAAARLYQEAIEMGQASGNHPRTIPLLINLGDVAASQGDLPRAWKMQEEAGRLADRFDLPHWRAGATALRGDLLARERRWLEAQHAYELALERGRSLVRRPNIAQIRLGEAWARGEMGDPREGLAVLDRLQQGPTPLPPEYEDTFYEVRARLKELQGDFPGARLDLEAARAQTGPSPHRQARILGDLASWEVLHGTPEKAAQLRESADELYRAAGVEPTRARPTNEVFPGDKRPGSEKGDSTLSDGTSPF